MLCNVEDILLFHEQCFKYRTEEVYVGPATSRQDLFRLTLLCVECKAGNISNCVCLCVLIKRTAWQAFSQAAVHFSEKGDFRQPVLGGNLSTSVLDVTKQCV